MLRPPGAEDGARDRPSHGWRHLAVNGAVISGLAGVAVAQPLLDIFGRNPMFFVAGGYGRRQIVAFAMVIALVPGLVVWAATALPGLLHRSATSVLHHLAVAGLAGLFGLVLARSLDLDGVASALAFATVVGIVVALAEARLRPARQFLSYLAPSGAVFLALFTFTSPTAELLRGGSYADAGEVVVPPLDGPVTLIVFDEFPLASIMRPDGTINDTRYPNLAALASESTWFRNASTESPFTAYSVPSILSGVLAGKPDLPVLRDFPRNLFTIFGRSYPVHRFEAITDLCPTEACGRPPAQPLSRALDDASVVYRHKVLPAPWREDLPPVDQGWGGFGELVDAPASPRASASSPPPSQGPNDLLNEIAKEDRGPRSQLDVMVRQARLIDASPSLNVIHVLAPHVPYLLTPWGTVGTEPDGVGNLPEPGEPQYDRGFAELFALQSLQIGALDRTLGEVMAHLKEVGAWEDGTFVVVSDHGRVTSRPGNGRTNSDGAEDEVLRVPLFIKGPGQTDGEVRDDPASTIDVLPSLVDLLGVETDWDFDGHSLYDGSEPTHERRLRSDLDDLFALVEWEQSFFPHGEDWVGIAGIGPQGRLVGTAVSDHDVGSPSEMAWSLDQQESIDDPSTTNGRVPVRVTGTIRGSDDRPDDLVVAIDDQIAGTVGVRESDGDDWTFSGVLGPPGIDGRGEDVIAYEVEDTGGRTILHPLTRS